MPGGGQVLGRLLPRPRLLAQQRVAHLGLAQPGDELGVGQVVHGPEGGVGDEGVERALEAEQHAGRPGRDLRGDAGAAGLVDAIGVGQRLAEALGRSGGLGHRVGDVDAPGGQPVHHLPIGVLGPVVGDELEEAAADPLERIGDDRQLVVDGEGARHVAVLGAVQDRARRREAEPARPHAVGDDLGDALVLLGGEVVLVGPFAEHVGADGGVGNLGAEVDGAVGRGQRVEVLAERLPLPVDALVQGGAGDVLHRLHDLDEEVLVAGADRGEADPAAAHDRGGDAVVRGRGHLRVPDRLAVVVGVDVDPAGGDERAVGVDLLAAALVHAADGDDLVAVDGDVGGAGRRSRPVHDGSAPDHEIMHGSPSSCGARPRPSGPRYVVPGVLGAVHTPGRRFDQSARVPEVRRTFSLASAILHRPFPGSRGDRDRPA